MTLGVTTNLSFYIIQETDALKRIICLWFGVHNAQRYTVTSVSERGGHRAVKELNICILLKLNWYKFKWGVL